MRICYCFLVAQAPIFPYWEAWLGDAMVKVHSKGRTSLPKYWHDRHVAETVETRWGHISLVDAALSMFLEAVDDGADRVVLISDSCAPLKRREDFEQWCQKSERGDRSFSSFYPPDPWPSEWPRGRELFKTSQFVSLTRGDVLSCLIAGREEFRDWRTPPDEFYFATVLARLGAPMLDADLTFAKFKKHQEHPEPVSRLDGSLLEALPFAFVRKVTPWTVIDDEYLYKILPPVNPGS